MIMKPNWICPHADLCKLTTKIQGHNVDVLMKVVLFARMLGRDPRNKTNIKELLKMYSVVDEQVDVQYILDNIYSLRYMFEIVDKHLQTINIGTMRQCWVFDVLSDIDIIPEIRLGVWLLFHKGIGINDIKDLRAMDIANRPGRLVIRPPGLKYVMLRYNEHERLLDDIQRHLFLKDYDEPVFSECMRYDPIRAIADYLHIDYDTLKRTYDARIIAMKGPYTWQHLQEMFDEDRTTYESMYVTAIVDLELPILDYKSVKR